MKTDYKYYTYGNNVIREDSNRMFYLYQYGEWVFHPSITAKIVVGMDFTDEKPITKEEAERIISAKDIR